jgi:hypothetical protein
MKAQSLPLIFAIFALTGCSHVDVSPSLSQTDEKLATQGYWLGQPAVATVAHDNYDELWEACIGSTRWRGYHIDRSDYRGGSLVMFPLVSKQFFEVWKRDTPAIADIIENSLMLVRRIVRFDVVRREDGTFACVPKVLVERFSQTEGRVTSVTRNGDVFAVEENQGSRERDKGNVGADAYWYTTGRDVVLEKDLADAIESRLRGMVARR